MQLPTFLDQLDGAVEEERDTASPACEATEELPTLHHYAWLDRGLEADAVDGDAANDHHRAREHGLAAPYHDDGAPVAGEDVGVPIDVGFDRGAVLLQPQKLAASGSARGWAMGAGVAKAAGGEVHEDAVGCRKGLAQYQLRTSKTQYL
jgi:hypothetical protein